MALKLRRDIDDFTNRRLPQQDGAVSFERVLGGPPRDTELLVTAAFCPTDSRTHEKSNRFRR